jgi:NAD-dependent dihydropyrimidine dehydrogenase PreA subunit
MYRAADGTVQHRDDLCIGCGRCVHHCPYGAPTLNRYTGYAQKCDACAERRAEGRQPACVEACPMRALHFGDLEELERQFGAGHGASLPFLPPEEGTNPSLVVRGAERKRNAGNALNRPSVEMLFYLCVYFIYIFASARKECLCEIVICYFFLFTGGSKELRFVKLFLKIVSVQNLHSTFACRATCYFCHNSSLFFLMPNLVYLIYLIIPHIT